MPIGFRDRLELRLELWREHTRAFITGVVLLAGLFGIVLFNSLYFASPVVRSERFEGNVLSVAMIPQKSYGEPTAATSYRYIVSLGDETAIVADQISRPHRVGSAIEVEKRTRANGAVTYHVVPPDCVAPDCVVPFNQRF